MATAKGPAKSQYVRHDVPEGEVIASGSGTREHVLRTLSPLECFDLIEPGGVGRVGFASADGIMMLPVNFAVSRKTIIFRTLLAAYSNGLVSFEADHFDEALHTGWSVLVTGRAHPVTGERELRQLEEGLGLEPWAAGPRDVYVRITPTRISGRRL
jgi:nitroimidazol reductase NimA-like FMN-containing flavoprotein (pyridoxamine 5'-phosphate oxidase superfamily)